MVLPEVIRNTYSVCPICLKRIPAQHVLIGDDVFLQKECARHGFFSSIIWRTNTCMSEWIGGTNGIEALSVRDVTEKGCCCSSEPVSADKNTAFVARRWERQEQNGESSSCCYGEPQINDMDYFLQRVKSHGFTVTAMAFQDAGNLDLERLRRCSLHVFDNGKIVPFCAHYLSGWE